MYHYFSIQDSISTPGLLHDGGCELRLDPVIAGRIDLALRELEGRSAEAGPESQSYFDLTRWRRKAPQGVAVQLGTFCERVHARRLELGLSATYVARRTGTSRGMLCRIERGRQAPSAGLERRLGRLLHPRRA